MTSFVFQLSIEMDIEEMNKIRKERKWWSELKEDTKRQEYKLIITNWLSFYCTFWDKWILKRLIERGKERI